MLYKIRKKVKKILKEKITEGELETTPTSCLGCVADEISWEIYYLLKEMKRANHKKETVCFFITIQPAFYATPRTQ